MPNFFETESPTSSTQIALLEKKLNLKIPDEYKAHLLRHNGGRCTPNVFSFTERGEKANSSVEWFLALYDGKSDNLEKTISMYKVTSKRLPSHIIPIADDGLGNLICISCGPNDYGYVYFWDHDREVNYTTSNDSDYSNLYLIAKGFDEFLASLRMTV